jgi:hypothetical protein
MSFIKASALGPLTASNTATIVDPATPSGGSATLSPLVLMNPVSLSGTTSTITGIPPWAKRVTVLYAGLSGNGSADPILRLGTSGGIVSSGYIGNTFDYAAGNQYTTAMGLCASSSVAAAYNVNGRVELFLINASSNQWVGSVTSGLNPTGGEGGAGGYSISLSGALTQVQLTWSNGTDAFDAGTFNVMYQ